MSAPEHKEKEPQHAPQAEETMKLDDFTGPAHHHPNDDLPDEYDEDWLLARGSGFASSLPNNSEWPVTERVVFPMPERVPAQKIEIQAPRTAFVCGANGLVGRTLVPTLVQRGCTRVIAFDITEVPEAVRKHHTELLGEGAPIEYICGSIANHQLLTPLLKDDIEVIFNVTPVNPITVLKVAAEVGIKKFVHISSPSTRISPDQEQVVNAAESELSPLLSFEYSHDSIKQKARSEQVVQEHNSEKMMTVVISPALVYGPNDDSFLNSLLSSAIDNNLRIVGDGENKVSVCHVDNVCVALLLAASKLENYEAKPAGEMYLISDDYDHYLWGLIDDLLIRGGLPSVKTHIKAPGLFTRAAAFVAAKIDPSTRLNPHNVRLLSTNRTYNISAAKADLGYACTIDFEPAWLKVCESLLKRHDLPFYPHTRFYYQHVQFEGFRSEVKKVEHLEEEERRRMYLEHEAEKKRQEVNEAEVKRRESAATPVPEAPKKVEKVEQFKKVEQPEIQPPPAPVEPPTPPVVVDAPKIEPPTPPVEEPVVAEPTPIVEEVVFETAPIEVAEEAAEPVATEEVVADEEAVAEDAPQSGKKGRKGKKH